MAAQGSTYSNDLLKLIFQALPISGLADNAASGAITNLSIALHTADPGAAGNQTTFELSYGEYVRQNVARSTAGWIVTGNSVSPANPIVFPTMLTGTGGTVVYWSVGTGVGNKLLYRGTVLPTFSVIVGVPPRLATSSAIIEA